MRRGAPVFLVTIGLVLLLGSYVAYTRHLVAELQKTASYSGRIYARVFRALASPSEDGGTAALLDLAGLIDSLGVPVIVTDRYGKPAAAANLPFRAPLGDPRVMEYVRELDMQNAPVIEPGVGVVHIGNTPLVRGLRIIPLVQAGMLSLLLIAGTYGLRTRGRAEREKVMAGMARESAHQLGTPLSSMAGWLELLRDRADEARASSGGAADTRTLDAITHMQGDLERLDRVAHRFERIGRPPRREPVDLGALSARVVDYFRARVPSRANAVAITHDAPATPAVIEGDPVLLEWALEVLVKNAVDALAGRGGSIALTVSPLPGGGARLRVADDGPGVPRELRQRIFSAGFSTKERGWGLGLALARRIVEENHAGRLLLVAAERGATFDVILR